MAKNAKKQAQIVVATKAPIPTPDDLTGAMISESSTMDLVRWRGSAILIIVIGLLLLDLFLTPLLLAELDQKGWIELESWWYQHDYLLVSQRVILSILATLFLGLILLIFLRWVTVKEGTAMAIMRFGSFSRMVFSKQGWKINPITGETTHVPGYKDGPLGGLRFYIWLVEDIYQYSWQWVKSVPGIGIIAKPEETVNFILTRQIYSYGLKIVGKGLVTTDKVPIEVSVTLTATIVNPYIALFSVKNWFDTFIGRIQPAIREYISARSYGVIISDSDDDQKKASKANLIFLDAEIMEELRKRHILEELINTLGVELIKLEFGEVKAADEYQKMLTAQKEGEMEAKKRRASTTGAFMEMLAEETGLTLEQIRERCRNGRTAFEREFEPAIKRATALINRQIDAQTPGALRSYHFEGGSDGMSLIALLGEAFRGSTGSGEKNEPNPNNGDKTKKKKDKVTATTDDDNDENDDDDTDGDDDPDK